MSESEKQRQDYSSKLNELNQLMSVAQQQLNAEINSADLDICCVKDFSQFFKLPCNIQNSAYHNMISSGKTSKSDCQDGVNGCTEEELHEIHFTR